jgi:hypothetical protein
VGGHQLEWRGTPHLHQHGVGNFLPVAVPRHGYCGQSVTSFMLMVPLGAEAISQPGFLSGWHATYVLGKFSR